MKIISKGVDPATVPIIASCSKCKTQIEFLPCEAKYTSDQRDGDFYSIACPVCKSTITKNASTRPNYYTDH